MQASFVTFVHPRLVLDKLFFMPICVGICAPCSEERIVFPKTELQDDPFCEVKLWGSQAEIFSTPAKNLLCSGSGSLQAERTLCESQSTFEVALRSVGVRHRERTLLRNGRIR